MTWNVKSFRQISGVDCFSDEYIKECLDTVVRNGSSDRRNRVAIKLLTEVLTAPGGVNRLWAKNISDAGFSTSFFVTLLQTIVFVMRKTESTEFLSLDMNILFMWYKTGLSIEDLLEESRVYAGTTPSCYKASAVRSDSERQKAYEQFWEMLGVDYRLGGLTYPLVIYNKSTDEYIQQDSKIVTYKSWSDFMKTIKRLYANNMTKNESEIYEARSCSNQLYKALQKF